jgi:hypothetical protein
MRLEGHPFGLVYSVSSAPPLDSIGREKAGRLAWQEPHLHRGNPFLLNCSVLELTLTRPCSSLSSAQLLSRGYATFPTIEQKRGAGWLVHRYKLPPIPRAMHRRRQGIHCSP